MQAVYAAVSQFHHVFSVLIALSSRWTCPAPAVRGLDKPEPQPNSRVTEYAPSPSLAARMQLESRESKGGIATMRRLGVQSKARALVVICVLSRATVAPGDSPPPPTLVPPSQNGPLSNAETAANPTSSNASSALGTGGATGNPLTGPGSTTTTGKAPETTNQPGPPSANRPTAPGGTTGVLGSQPLPSSPSELREALSRLPTWSERRTLMDLYRHQHGDDPAAPGRYVGAPGATPATAAKKPHPLGIDGQTSGGYVEEKSLQQLTTFGGHKDYVTSPAQPAVTSPRQATAPAVGGGGPTVPFASYGPGKPAAEPTASARAQTIAALRTISDSFATQGNLDKKSDVDQVIGKLVRDETTGGQSVTLDDLRALPAEARQAIQGVAESRLSATQGKAAGPARPRLVALASLASQPRGEPGSRESVGMAVPDRLKVSSGNLGVLASFLAPLDRVSGEKSPVKLAGRARGATPGGGDAGGEDLRATALTGARGASKGALASAESPDAVPGILSRVLRALRRLRGDAAAAIAPELAEASREVSAGAVGELRMAGWRPGESHTRSMLFWLGIMAGGIPLARRARRREKAAASPRKEAA